MSAKLWAVVKREYLERVRTKGFVIGTVLGPLIMAGMMIVPALAARSGGKPLRVAVLDASGALQVAVEEALRDARFDGTARFDVRPVSDLGPEVGPAAAAGSSEAAFKKAVLEGGLDGYLHLPPDAVATGDGELLRPQRQQPYRPPHDGADGERRARRPAARRGRARPREGQGPHEGAGPEDDPPQRDRASGRTRGRR